MSMAKMDKTTIFAKNSLVFKAGSFLNLSQKNTCILDCVCGKIEAYEICEIAPRET